MLVSGTEVEVVFFRLLGRFSLSSSFFFSLLQLRFVCFHHRPYRLRHFCLTLMCNSSISDGQRKDGRRPTFVLTLDCQTRTAAPIPQPNERGIRHPVVHAGLCQRSNPHITPQSIACGPKVSPVPSSTCPLKQPTWKAELPIMRTVNQTAHLIGEA